jgi:hypothetical protein
MAEIYLDWSKDQLLGWEPEKSVDVVEAIVRGIKAGADFPAVPIHKVSENVYCLSPLRETKDGLLDGGHCRAIAHYLTGNPLKCELLGGLPPVPEAWEILIEEISLVPDSGQYAEHKKRFPNYL